jgi:predicted RND superfamily exporter protein
MLGVELVNTMFNSLEETFVKGFINWLVRHRVLVIILCFLLVIPSILGMAATKTKYDLLYYLPQDLETVKGQNILLEDFGKGAFSLIITEGMSVLEQAEMEKALKEIPHVESVMGYASITQGRLPLEILPEDIREKFYREKCMLSAVFFDEGSSSEETMEAIQQVRKVAGEKCFVSGLSAVASDTRQMVEEQELIYVGIAVALCAAMLMLTMDSFLLPLIFLVCIGVSIMWNMGSNYFLGEISYITKAVAAVLQLGVTLDYSIFLWHSYKEQKSNFEDKDEAMAEAVRLTFSSIIGSSLTTIAGFISICFMSFALGRDLGIVMSKGVIMGVLGTLIMLPCAIRLLDSAIEKTSHKPLLPNVGGIGRFVVKHYKTLAAVLLLIIFPVFYGYSNVNVYYDMSKLMPQEMLSVKANQKLKDVFNVSTAHLMLVDKDISPKDVRDMAAEMEQVDGVKNILGIDSLLGSGIPESIVPPEILSKVKGERYQLMLISSAYVISSDEINDQIDELNAILKSYDKSGMLIGEAPCTKDLIACTDYDFKVVSFISLIAIFVIIMLVQKSFSLPVLLVAIIELAIAANLCIPYYAGQELPFVGPILISTIQLGATVDYAILMTARYKQNRLSGLNKAEATQKAVASAAQSVLVSGLGFFAATYGVGMYSDVAIISSMCRLIARGALLSVAVVLFLLPSMLMLFDSLIARSTWDMRHIHKNINNASERNGLI